MEPREPRESSEGRERRLDEILAAYFQAKAAGQAPNRDLWISQYPEYATDLAEFFADQERFQVLANPLRRATHSTQGRSLTACEIPEPTEPDSSHFDHPSHATLPQDQPLQAAFDATLPQNEPLQAADDTSDLALTIQPTEGDDGVLLRGTQVRYIGDYEVKQVLGRGGMGVVYRAKQLEPESAGRPEDDPAGLWADSSEVRRFKNEAEAIANLDHPGIVTIHEVGEFQWPTLLFHEAGGRAKPGQGP